MDDNDTGRWWLWCGDEGRGGSYGMVVVEVVLGNGGR